MPRLLRGYVGLGCTPSRRRRTRMRTGTTASVRHNTTTPIPQGTYIFIAQSIYVSRESLRTLLLSSRISYEKITFKLLKRAFFHRQIIVCYYTISSDLNTFWELSPSHIDPDLCTHIIVGFAGVVNCSLDLGSNSSIYKEVIALKKLQPQLRVMISAGGSNELHLGFSEMVKNHANRKR